MKIDLDQSGVHLWDMSGRERYKGIKTEGEYGVYNHGWLGGISVLNSLDEFME